MGKRGHPCCFIPLWTEVGSKVSIRFGLISFELITICAFLFSPGCPCSLGLLNPPPSCSPFSTGSYKQVKRERP